VRLQSRRFALSSVNMSITHIRGVPFTPSPASPVGHISRGWSGVSSPTLKTPTTTSVLITHFPILGIVLNVKKRRLRHFRHIVDTFLERCRLSSVVESPHVADSLKGGSQFVGATSTTVSIKLFHVQCVQTLLFLVHECRSVVPRPNVARISYRCVLLLRTWRSRIVLLE